MKQVVLDTGRRIVLERYYKQKTYVSVVEGLPTPRLNAWVKDDFARSVKAVLRGPVYFMEPETRHEDGGVYLPAFACAGEFMSAEPVPGSAGMASGLIIAWFQDDADMVMAAAIEEGIRSVPWDEHANSFDW